MYSFASGSESSPVSSECEVAPKTAPRPVTLPRALPSIRQTSFAGIISECSAMQKVFSVVEKVARTNSTVLVLGESGTGKELVARAIHRISGRTGKLVPVNCGAIPEEILESELFGHERGAFTGAIAQKIGRFQLADEGTIFLDEIGEMSPKLQVKLLRVLQERKVEPVGSTRTIDVNVRVIAATNKDLREEVRQGRFREDLYYRLQVVPINLPALRDRGDDVVILARHFLESAAEEISRPELRLTEQIELKLRDYTWPGNVRELENLIERLAILGDTDQIDVSALPDYICEAPARVCQGLLEVEIPQGGVDFNALVDRYETHLITLALDKTGGNKKAAARLLGLNRTTLVEKIKKKGLAAQVEVLVEGDSPLSEPSIASELEG